MATETHGNSLSSIQPEPFRVCKIFPYVELEELSSDPDVEIKLNSLLLMARYQAANRITALDACHAHKYLPGEVELEISCLQETQYSTPCHQLELAQKILSLLSLKPFELLEGYESILGLYKGDVDDLYEEKNQVIDLLPTRDCYLLPHASQDIWIGTLCQGKAITDIDGMCIIQGDTLFEKVSSHLKRYLKHILQGAFEDAILDSPLWQYLKARVPAINGLSESSLQKSSAFLKLCNMILVSNSYFDKSRRDTTWNTNLHKAIKVLRLFHSISVSSYSPICENYMSYMDAIRGDAWRYFQMEIKRLIESNIRKEGTNLDFLEVWELSSVAKVTSTSREILESEAITPQNNIVLDWFFVSEKVIDYPVKSCEMFVDKCLTNMLHEGSNLHSVVNAVTVYGTITLALLSASSRETEFSPIIPYAHHRALLV